MSLATAAVHAKGDTPTKATPVVAMDEEEVRVPDISTLSNWDRDITLMRYGMKLLFSNNLAGAETVFQRGQAYSQEQVPGVDDHDNAGAFALMYALVSVIKGIASLSDDSLDECLDRLQTADKLTSKSKDWIGKTAIRGICTLEIGFVQIMKHKFVKGIWNILKSWKWISAIRDHAMDYPGKERDVIRSVALMTVGIFEVILALLPDSMMKAASFVTGFGCDREHGLSLLWKCYEEKGILAPWGALIWVGFVVDAKTFLGEKQTEEEFNRCRQVLDWVHEEYPNSVFFCGMEADLNGCMRQPEKAIEIITKAEPFVGKLRAIEWALNYKKGIYEVSQLKFHEASISFEKSQDVYIECGRRSMVPFMAGYTFFTALLDDTEPEGGKLRAAKMLQVIEEYKGMKKSDWGRQDTWAFELAERYTEFDCETWNDGKLKGSAWPLLDTVESMCIRMRCTFFMHSNVLEGIMDRLNREMTQQENDLSSDAKIRAYMCMCDISLNLGNIDVVLKSADEGLLLEPKLSKYGKRFAVGAVLHYYKAKALAELGDIPAATLEIRTIKKYSKSQRYYHMALFKSNNLAKMLGADLEMLFESVDVKVGASFECIQEVSKVSQICLEWYVQSRNIDFEIFQGGTSLMSNMRRSSNDGMYKALFHVEMKPGTKSCLVKLNSPTNSNDTIQEYTLSLGSNDPLNFRWDNKLSYMRGKQVHYKVSVEYELDDTAV